MSTALSSALVSALQISACLEPGALVSSPRSCARHDDLSLAVFVIGGRVPVCGTPSDGISWRFASEGQNVVRTHRAWVLGLQRCGSVPILLNRIR